MATKSGVRSHCWTRSNVRQFLFLFSSDLKLSKHEIVKLIMAHPQLLNYRTATLKQSIDFLQDELGLDILRMIHKRPMFLTYSVDEHLIPVVIFLRSMGSDGWNGWRRMIESYPQLLSHSVETKLKPKLAFLAASLKLTRRQDAVHIVSTFPPIFWLQADLLQDKMDFLQTALQLDDDELSFLITSFPQVLGLSIEQNLKPKLAFLLQHLTMEQLREFIAYQPSLLAYSLENRLRPRIDLMEKNGIAIGYSPRYLMSLTDAKFHQWYVHIEWIGVVI